MEIILLELFSGAGGFAKGIEEAGFTIKKCFFSEVDKHAIANYKYNFKDAEYIGSVKSVRHIIRVIGEYRRNNPGFKLVITFGSPCQDFSLAGQRGGLEGAKSSLIKYALFLVKWLRPDVFIWENVKGAYSTNAGADYWAIIQAFANLDGYRHEQQLLNTSWFLPQNRERIYSVGYIAGRCKPGIFPIGKYDELANKTLSKKGNQIKVANTLSSAEYKLNCETNYVIPSNTRRGRVGKGRAQTLDTACNQGVIQLNPSKESGGKQPYQQNRCYDVNGISTAIDQAAGKWSVNNTTGIRRLTEIECERLQGFPEVKKSCIFTLCLESQKNHVNVEEKNHKSQKPVGNAEKQELKESAPFADQNLSVKNLHIKKLAQQNVHILFAENRVEIHSQGKSLLSVSNAELEKMLAPHIQIENFALQIVHINTIWEKIIQAGEADYLQKDKGQIQVKNGKMHVNLFGKEMGQHVNCVKSDTPTIKKHTKYTTLNHSGIEGLDTRFLTLCCYVANVMNLYIPKKTLNNYSLTIQIEIKHGWTQYGIYTDKNGNETTKEIPRTQRYKLMGNAVTVAVVKEVATRIKNNLIP